MAFEFTPPHVNRSLMKKILAIFVFSLMALPLHASDVMKQPDVQFLIEKEIPKATEKTELCNLCVYKLLPSQAQIKLACDDDMKIDYNITAYPREKAKTFSAAVQTAAFLQMEKLGFVRGALHHNGACAFFVRTPETANKAAASEPARNLTAEEERVFFEGLQNTINTEWPEFFGPADKSNYLDEMNFRVDGNTAFLTYVVKPVNEDYRGIVDVRIDDFHGINDLVRKDDKNEFVLTQKMRDLVEIEIGKGLKEGRAFDK